MSGLLCYVAWASRSSATFGGFGAKVIVKSIILVVGLLIALGLHIPVASDPNSRSSSNQSGTINHSTPCPTINVACLSMQRVGENISFKAFVQGGAKSAKVTYKWNLSAGRVIQGKNAATIIVSTRNLRPGEITALVKVGGFPNPCPLTASCSLTLVKEP